MKSIKTLALAVAGMACFGAPNPATADDIDVFVGGAGTATKPNLLIVLDSSSNWSASLATDPAGGPSNQKKTKFYHEMKALDLILNELGKCAKAPDGSCTAKSIGEGLNLGLMMFAETGTNGGYVRYALREMNVANRNALNCMLSGQGVYTYSYSGSSSTPSALRLPCDNAASPGLKESGSDTDNSASNQPYAKTMFEVFKYFGGYTSPAYAFKDQQPPGAINDVTHFGPRAYAGWGSDSGSDKGAIRRDYLRPANINAPTNPARTAYKAFLASGGTYNGGAFTDSADNEYNNPVSDACAKNFIMFLSNGNPGTGGDSGETTLLANVNDGDTTTIKNPNGSELHPSYGDEFARFLYQTDVSALPGQQNVITYTMAVYDEADASQTSTRNMINLMTSMANAGHGNYYEATNGDQIVDGLLSAINQILARDSTFVTASLPVNTNAQGEFLNQVFIGMFRPDGNATPRWWGNLKQYRLACMLGLQEDVYCTCLKSTDDASCQPGGVPTFSKVQLVDSSSSPPKIIYSAGTAFIDSNVRSYWTETSTFWQNDPRGTSDARGSDSPDGEVVEKGGVAQRLRVNYATDQSSRNVLTCAGTGTADAGVTSSCGSSGASLINFDTSTLTRTANDTKFFQSTTPIPGETDIDASALTWEELSNTNQTTMYNRLINWVRGTDNITPRDERGPGGTVTVRPSIHGDVVHSRPVALDFGGSTGVVLFYGDNHGHLHAVKGNPNAASPNNGGSELWSFIAPEFFPKFARLRANQPVMLTPITPGGIDPAPRRKDYFWDGAITAYQNKTAGSEKVYLYVTARRGGRFIYALDVTTPTTPKFLWKIDPSTAGFSKIGQTWSAPVVTKVNGYSNPVLIFGGGYPGDYENGVTPICEDAEGTNRDHTTAAKGCDRGYGVYIVDALNGSLIKHIAGNGIDTASGTTTTTVPMDYAIPSDVYPLDSDFDGYTDRLYVGDLGGRLWRIEISAVDNVGDADTTKWEAYLLGSFGTDRKIFYRPGVVQQNTFTAVMVGSGDREKPLDLGETEESKRDGFYMVKDPVNGFLSATALRSWNSIAGSSLCEQNLTNGVWACDSGATYGWRYVLGKGEKVVNSPRIAFSVLNFATNTPTANTPNQCLNTGDARSYQTNFLDGTSAFANGNLYQPIPTGGLAPTAFVGIVDINGVKVPVIIGGGVGDSGCVGPTCASSKPLNISATRTKRYWYKR